VGYLFLELVPEFLLDSFGADGTTRALVGVFDRLIELKIAYAGDR